MEKLSRQKVDETIKKKMRKYQSKANPEGFL